MKLQFRVFLLFGFNEKNAATHGQIPEVPNLSQVPLPKSAPVFRHYGR